jgi:hypothetical protein
MFLVIAIKLEFSRYKDYPNLWPKMFFSDLPSFPHTGTIPEKNFQKSE